MVALVRGVHGLNGAVRAEVLTDRPQDRFVVGGVLFREGDARPLTIAAAEEIVDGPGWRLRFREVTSRDAADTLRGAYLESVVVPDQDLARGHLLLARGHRLCRPRHGRDRPRDRARHLPDRRDRGLHGRRQPVRQLRPARRSRVHPGLRAAPWRDRRRRRVARPAAATIAGVGPRPAEGAAPADATHEGGRARRRRRPSPPSRPRLAEAAEPASSSRATPPPDTVA